MIPNAYSLFLTSSFIVKVNLNYLILWMMSPLANVFADYFIEKITTIREELQEKGVLQTIPKLNCCIVALGLIISSQYHVINCLTWFLDRL